MKDHELIALVAALLLAGQTKREKDHHFGFVFGYSPDPHDIREAVKASKAIITAAQQ